MTRPAGKDRSPESELPLMSATFEILMALVDGERHGYAILKDIQKLSDGRVRLSTGTLYGALRRLLEDGWIVRFQEEDRSRAKQAYRLTALGRRNLQEEVSRMKQLTRVASLRAARKEA